MSRQLTLEDSIAPFLLSYIGIKATFSSGLDQLSYNLLF